MIGYRHALWPIASLSLGCASVVVHKAHLQHIRSLALVSLFSSERVIEVHGQGILRKMDNEGRLQIAEDALNEFREAFTRIGWKVIDTQKVVEHPAYKNLLSRPPGSGPSSFLQVRYITPEGMFALWLPPQVENPPGRHLAKTQRDGLQDLLADTKAQAAAMVEVQYCFRTFSKDRREFLRVTAASAVQFAGTEGQILYETDKLETCGQDARGESRGTMEISEEDWIYDPLKRDEIRQLFREASQAEAIRLVSNLPVTPRENYDQRRLK